MYFGIYNSIEILKMKKKIWLFSLLVIYINTATANMMGSTIKVEVYSPTKTQPISNPAFVIVKSPGVEIPDIADFTKYSAGFRLMNTSIDISTNTIAFDYNDNATASTAIFNGYVFTDINNTVPDIIGVTINPATNVDLISSDISFNKNQIAVNVSGLAFNTNSFILLNIRFATVEPKCDGKNATIKGTSRNDVIFGTKGADVISAGFGDDVIYGLDGDDVICGGAGNDIILGGAGSDQLLGSVGNDYLNGGSEDDILVGETGFDVCDGDSQVVKDIALTCEKSYNAP